MNGLIQLLRFLDMGYRTYRGWLSRREWHAGRTARIRAEVARSNRYIAAQFPSHARGASHDPPVEKEAS